MAPLSIIFLTEFNKTRLNICLILLQDYIHKILFSHKIFLSFIVAFLGIEQTTVTDIFI